MKVKGKRNYIKHKHDAKQKRYTEHTKEEGKSLHGTVGIKRKREVIQNKTSNRKHYSDYKHHIDTKKNIIRIIRS